jgi:hypothetical protein
MSEDVQGRIRQLKLRKRFWKRFALVAAGALLLVLATFATLSITLYNSLMAEKDRFAQHLQDFRKTAEDGLNEGKEFLRGLKFDPRKVKEKLRQFLEGDAPKEPPPVPPQPPVMDKGGPQLQDKPEPPQRDGCVRPDGGDKVGPQLQDFPKTVEEGLQQGRELLRGLKIDRRKVEQRLRQFLEGDAPKEQAPVPPGPDNGERPTCSPEKGAGGPP